jgi:hypothetical protein
MTYGDPKAAVVYPPSEYDLKKGTDLQNQYNQSISVAITNHAIKIDDLHQKVSNILAFVEWVGNTHPDVFEQYNAIQDLKVASNG